MGVNLGSLMRLLLLLSEVCLRLCQLVLRIEEIFIRIDLSAIIFFLTILFTTETIVVPASPLSLARVDLVLLNRLFIFILRLTGLLSLRGSSLVSA